MPIGLGEKIVKGQLYIQWACPYTLNNGRDCGRLHWVAWDRNFDSPCDGESLYCNRHKDKED